MGFPLSNLDLGTDEINGTKFLTGDWPPQVFPLDGIMTRVFTLTQAEPPKPYRLMHVETSTTSLPGHSGGAAIDEEGVVWAILCKDRRYKLEDKASSTVLTFSTGIGVHCETIKGFCDEHGVKLQIAT
jgi:hypothetical protein